MSQAQAIKTFILQNISRYPQEIVAVTAHEFGVTRTTIHRHLNSLIKHNQIFKTGTTKQVRYFVTEQRDRKYQFKIKPEMTHGVIWQHYLAGAFEGVALNLVEILHYGFQELFTNVLTHAQATSIEIDLKWQQQQVQLSINDNGIGIFEKLKQHWQLADYYQCAMKLSTHRSEGLFYTSHLFDSFSLIANGICYFRDNTQSDWGMQSAPLRKGTQVILKIANDTQKKLQELLPQIKLQQPMSKTECVVNLKEMLGDNLLARAQAKQVLDKIKTFSKVTLDFSQVRILGQGFADEIFGVFSANHQGIEVQYIHADPTVEFMIKQVIK
jgi:anti-sigma regulatory factor (Ser/Thr protein kinase)